MPRNVHAGAGTTTTAAPKARKAVKKTEAKPAATQPAATPAAAATKKPRVTPDVVEAGKANRPILREDQAALMRSALQAAVALGSAEGSASEIASAACSKLVEENKDLAVALPNIATFLSAIDQDKAAHIANHAGKLLKEEDGESKAIFYLARKMDEQAPRAPNGKKSHYAERTARAALGAYAENQGPDQVAATVAAALAKGAEIGSELTTGATSQALSKFAVPILSDLPGVSLFCQALKDTVDTFSAPAEQFASSKERNTAKVKCCLKVAASAGLLLLPVLAKAGKAAAH